MSLFQPRRTLRRKGFHKVAMPKIKKVGLIKTPKMPRPKKLY
jgi:hypothetical protein